MGDTCLNTEVCLEGDDELASVLDRLVDGSGAWDAPYLRFGTDDAPDSGSESESKSKKDI